MIRSIFKKNSSLPYFLKRSFITKPHSIITPIINNNNHNNNNINTPIKNIQSFNFKFFTTTTTSNPIHQQTTTTTTTTPSTEQQQLSKEAEEINENITKYNITLTDSCVKELNSVQKKSDSTDIFLRVMVDMGGCSGYQYIIKVENKLQDDDVLFIRNGAKVIIDKISLEMMEGSIIDYETALMRSSFVVASNPNTIKSCGCKISFELKK
ncbi:HesB/YadR/YfhF domain-containing protein [Dictyostelium discoideum AX4]|uniref:Iron-sulfur cluster assembly 2 homolog, mitochondrial n=1 Tax=Dictyostelium discoideum TaxID=44689 RepID=ISCA2_DICDI|nr:HesB/YadR/YfhF domain-containing protein [Dictyostelium discoideum AX4]Q54P40.1 RecName: Full=Iron-sulfur cluster assembly 2 homolog, mitochondrial; AltName: Full=Iron-sulfur assembly protein isca2; Flags: Precursor [Dictyostelium discoideum]EAL65057.1 HesB/YadR/YfhF domain-containing protein [Dictyostelium discoideum AX4]|eukprot:XP_638418.1 HesB/YadR/YfhF domain-containing protein [Dictyostelium discoideum AX4]